MDLNNTDQWSEKRDQRRMIKADYPFLLFGFKFFYIESINRNAELQNTKTFIINIVC